MTIASFSIQVGKAPGTSVHDHFSVYTTTIVAGGIQETSVDHFIGTRGSGGARTALETHGGVQKISRNSVLDYLRAANVAGRAEVGTDGVTVSHNTFSGVSIGVQLWSQRVPERGNAPALRNVSIFANEVSIDRDAWILPGVETPASGVLINTSNTDTITGLSIRDNLISYEQTSRPERLIDKDAAAFYCQIITADAQFSDLEIVDNRIISPLLTGFSPT